VLHPKVHVAWVLDRVFAEWPLDFMVLFSSIAALEGNVFQADYSAANRFLDSFARWRNSQGRRTLCIHWGLWRELGMGRDLAREGQIVAANSMSTSGALDALGRSMSLGTDRVVISPAIKSDASARRPRELASPATDSRQTKKLSQGPLRRRLAEQVDEVLCETLRIPPDRLDHRRSFVDLGMDSMLAVRFAKALEAVAGCELPATLPFDFPDAERLVEHLLETRDLNQVLAPTRAATQSVDISQRRPASDGLRLKTGRQVWLVPRRPR